MDLDASVGLGITPAELPCAEDQLQRLLAADDSPDLHLALGLAVYLVGRIEEGERHLREAFLRFRRDGRPRKAALTAAHLGRVEYAGFRNPVVAGGWFARGLALLEDDEDCVERGWLALAMLGCSVCSADELHRNAALALSLARRHADSDLECRALADYGLALVSQGQFAEGAARLDEAMAMVHSGECTNLYVVGQVQCSFITACERSGDVPRLEGWLAAAVRQHPQVFGAQAPPNVIMNHCRTEYGTLLCLAGRWSEAERMLRDAFAVAPSLQQQHVIQVNCALADLRVSQGRLAEAAELLAGNESWDEACLPLARLHLARGETDQAIATCHVGLSRGAGDRLRGSALLGLLVEAHLARGDLPAAQEAISELVDLAQQAPRPPIRARAVLARAQLALALADPAAAVACLQEGLAALHGEHWSLLAAERHLHLARALAATRPLAAAGHARRALSVYGPIGAPQRLEAQRLLEELGAGEAACPDPLDVLTGREREILRLLAQGRSNPQIADGLFISPRTVEHHVGAILRKLGVQTRSEAAVYAATLGA